MKLSTAFIFFSLVALSSMLATTSAGTLEYRINATVESRTYRFEVRDYSDGFKTIAVLGQCADIYIVRADLKTLAMMDDGTTIDCFERPEADASIMTRGSEPDADGDDLNVVR